MSLKINLLICSILLACIFTLVQSCRPGQYKDIIDPYDPSKFTCVPCNIGYFCPDGENEILCPDGYIATKYSTIKCQSCNRTASGSNAERTVCLLPGAPKNMKEVFPNNFWFINVNSTSSPSFAFLTYGKSSVLRLRQGVNDPKPVTVFASRNTPAPSPSNFELVSKDINPTFYLDNPNYEDNQSEMVMYFSVIQPINTDFVFEFLNL